ncbi:DUF3313 domain-containing protein [Rhizobium jaguaris]|uniref:DUF3313 domain-containing protein n=1 Tax=Rhizobium jaguaris TaxID=1312183 RepID=UPI0039BEEDED
MNTSKVIAALIIACSTIAGCTTADPTVYAGLTSASQLQPNPEDRSGRTPYRFRSDVDWRRYNKIIVDPVTVYSGQDNQFVKISEQDKATLASYMQAQFTDRLKTRFAIVNMPMPGTLRLHLTLTGAKTTTPFLGPFSHIDVGGGVYNAVQAARGKEGSMTGSVNYAVEIFDALSNRLLSAYVTKQYPNAMNAGAAFGALEASKVGIRKGADALLAQFK